MPRSVCSAIIDCTNLEAVSIYDMKLPRAITNLTNQCKTLMALHDDAADLRAYFDGHGEITDESLACTCIMKIRRIASGTF